MKPSILTRISNSLTTWRPFKIEEKLIAPSNTDKKRVSYQIRKHRQHNFDIEQDDLKLGIQMATDEFDPRREKLLQCFREFKRDLNLLAECQNGVDDCLQHGWGWFNDETGVMNLELTKLYQKSWFEKLMSIYLWSEHEGYKIAEGGMMIQTKNGWEFKNFKEFPQENILPERGLLVAHPTAQYGLPFRPEDHPEGSKERLMAEEVSKWLFECGDPEHLGLFATAGVNSIYKKYGKGDWARSSEKWIDPAIVIRSGTDNETENDKKADMAANWGNNNWMLLDDQDEVELLERKNANGFHITKEFLEYLDRENAKGINGQYATSSEKSFVGSAEVQERTQIKRTRRRLRSLAYWINEYVKDKLMEVNNGDNAYMATEGHSWIPLIFLEEEEGENTDPSQSDDPKKSVNPKNKKFGGTSVGKFGLSPSKARLSGYGYHTEIANTYNDNHDISNSHRPNRPYNISTLETLAKKMADRIYEKKIKAGNIEDKLTEAQAKYLIKALNEGFSKPITKVIFASDAHRTRIQLQHNIHVIAAFKNHQNVLDIHQLLFDEEGKVKPKAKFLKDIEAINKDYNRNWAATEYRLAKGQAQMADKYLLYKDRGGSFVYVSMRDGRVRPEHEKLHGLTAPVDHPIWDSILPKNGFGCRCIFRWIKDAIEKISDQAQEFADNLPKIWKNNAGKSGRVFTEDHPYFEVAQKYLKKAEKLFGFKPPVNLDRFNQNMSLYETLKESKDHELLSSFLESGGFLFRHTAFDTKDFTNNKKAAERLAQSGYSVEIREHINTAGIPNPELTVVGNLSDLKTPKKIGGIKSAFGNAKKQKINELVIDINRSWPIKEVAASIGKGFYFTPEIEKVIIIRGKDVIEITRADWQSNLILERLKS